MKRLKLVAIIATAIPLTAATGRPNGTRIAVGIFQGIELNGSDSIVIVQGQRASVVASGDASAVAALRIDVRNGLLRIGRLSGTLRDGDALVTITTPSLKSAKISGSGDIRIESLVGERFVGSISGSGNLILTDVRVGAANLDLSGSGSIVAGGRADAVAITLSGSGRIDTRAISTPVIKVDLGGDGIVDVSASRVANIGASGSGRVSSTGGARCDVRRIGLANVHCS